jgi:hypothetical protein
MITNLEVSLADMYTGRTVEVCAPYIVLSFSSKYLGRSSVRIVVVVERHRRVIYINVDNVMDKGLLFKDIKSSQEWLLMYK